MVRALVFSNIHAYVFVLGRIHAQSNSRQEALACNTTGILSRSLEV